MLESLLRFIKPRPQSLAFAPEDGGLPLALGQLVVGIPEFRAGLGRLVGGVINGVGDVVRTRIARRQPGRNWGQRLDIYTQYVGYGTCDMGRYQNFGTL